MFRTPGDLPTMVLDWGSITWFVSPDDVEGAASSFGEVIVNPGAGHDRHRHPEAEEILYVVSGEGLQMVDDGEPFVIRAGDAVHIPKDVWHATHNTTWRQLRLVVTYTPGGEERALRDAPDFELLPPGTNPRWVRPGAG